MINPPVGPAQLPPHTEGFSFSHAASGVNVTDVRVIVRDHSGTAVHDQKLGSVPYGDVIVHPIGGIAAGEGAYFVVNVTTSAGNFTFHSVPQATGTHVCYAEVGIRLDNVGSVLPFGVYTLSSGAQQSF